MYADIIRLLRRNAGYKNTAWIMVLVIILLGACASPLMITGSWRNPSYKSKNYNNILVAALTNHAVAKATVETDMVDELSKYDINVTKSIDLFPPNLHDADSDRVAIMDKVHGKNIDAILTISLLKTATESHYVPGNFAYDPYVYGYYHGFWNYYSYWYPYSYSPGYYTAETVYYIETNLYDTQTDEMVWSAQSQTGDLYDLPALSKDFAKGIATELKKNGILRGELKNNEKASAE